MVAGPPNSIAGLIRHMLGLGLHLVKLEQGLKKPVLMRWTEAVALSADQAIEHVGRGGNLGVHLGKSRLVVIDAENRAATNAMVEAGFVPTVIPAKAQVPPGHPCESKIGGSHTWLRVPSSIEDGHLHTVLGIRIANGGVFDALAGDRQAVAPPSALNQADGRRYVPAAGGILDFAAGAAEIPEAPEWLFDASYAQRRELLAAS
jgi:hypothetical protein